MPSAEQRPRALIVSLYGLYARETDGWLSIAALVRLLAEVGVDEPAVRSSISRLKRRGILEARRAGALAGYALSDHARAILDEGDRRIFTRERATGDDGWVLAVFSVPEHEREKRHQLRSRLSWLGFGTVTAGVWIAPAHLQEQTRDVLRRAGLDAYVQLFRGTSDVPVERVATWWDLDRLHALYAAFAQQYRPVLIRYRRRRHVDTRDAFVDHLRALTDWRRLPYSDPGLPVALLPPRWPGSAAADTFFELHRRLVAPAHTYVATVRAG